MRVMNMDADGLMLAVGGTTNKNGATVQGVPTVLIFDFDSGELKHTLAMGAAKDCYVHEVHLHQSGFAMAVTCGTPGAGQVLFHR